MGALTAREKNSIAFLCGLTIQVVDDIPNVYTETSDPAIPHYWYEVGTSTMMDTEKYRVDGMHSPFTLRLLLMPAMTICVHLNLQQIRNLLSNHKIIVDENSKVQA